MPKTLTDTQLIILADAAKRDDGAVIIPERVKGGAAQKVVEKLVTAKLVEEIAAKANFPIWRRDDETGLRGLRITKAGLVAIGAEEHVESNVADEPAPRKSNPAKRTSNKKTNSRKGADAGKPREGGKRAAVIAMLQRPNGASIDELTKATGWLPHTTRAALTGLRKAGHDVQRAREKRGKAEMSVYRIVNAASRPASTKGKRRSG